MRKFFIVPIFMAFYAFISVAQSASAETFRVAFSCDYHPFNFRDTDGTLKGYDVDVAKGVLEILGADMEEVCQKWDGMIPSLLA